MLLQLTTLLVAATAVAASKTIDICASSGLGLDVFGIADNKTIFHKYYRNSSSSSSWQPNPNFESMNGIVPKHAPTAISFAPGRLDYFIIGTDKAAYHGYSYGREIWRPAGKYHERLGGKFTSGLVAASWGKGRIDLVGKGKDDQYHHLFLDDCNWQPDINIWEDFGGNFSSKPAAVSWGPNRIDIIGITAEGTMAHKYWDGSSWAPDFGKWEDFGGSFVGDPMITSMQENRFDMWAAGVDGALHHKYWSGQRYTDWESLGGNFSTAPQVVHHSPNRIDIAGQFAGDDTQYQYKLYDGSRWLPDMTGWYPKGGDFATQPAVVTTRPNEFNIFGIGNDGKLYLQLWDGSNWLPNGMGYYPLGDTKTPYSAEELLVAQEL